MSDPTPAALAALDLASLCVPMDDEQRHELVARATSILTNAILAGEDWDTSTWESPVRWATAVLTFEATLLAAARHGAGDTEDAADAADEELSDELNAHLDTQRALVLLANQLVRHSIPFVPEAEVATYKARRAVDEYDRLLARGVEAARKVFDDARAARAAHDNPETTNG